MTAPKEYECKTCGEWFSIDELKHSKCPLGHTVYLGPIHDGSNQDTERAIRRAKYEHLKRERQKRE